MVVAAALEAAAIQYEMERDLSATERTLAATNSKLTATSQRLMAEEDNSGRLERRLERAGERLLDLQGEIAALDARLDAEAAKTEELQDAVARAVAARSRAELELEFAQEELEALKKSLEEKEEELEAFKKTFEFDRSIVAVDGAATDGTTGLIAAIRDQQPGDAVNRRTEIVTITFPRITGMQRCSYLYGCLAPIFGADFFLYIQ